MGEPTCYGCKYLADTFGNYVECKKTAERCYQVKVNFDELNIIMAALTNKLMEKSEMYRKLINNKEKFPETIKIYEFDLKNTWSAIEQIENYTLIDPVTGKEI